MYKVKHLTVRTGCPVGRLSKSQTLPFNERRRRNSVLKVRALTFRFDCESLPTEAHAKTSPELFGCNDSLRLTVRSRAATLTG